MVTNTTNKQTNNLLTPGGRAERATITNLLVHFLWVPCLLVARTVSRLAYVVPSISIVGDSRGLVVLLVGWLEGASPSVQHPFFGS